MVGEKIEIDMWKAARGGRKNRDGHVESSTWWEKK
jgi:hypothetical protein